MKNIILTIFLIILIPFLIVNIYSIENSNNFKIISNTIVRVKRESSNTIDEVLFEDYIIGVVAGEMPASFEIEALKAQTIAARTYVLKKIEQNNNEEYDIVDTVLNQVYLDIDDMKEKWGEDFEIYYNKIKEVVYETQGLYLEYDGQIIDALYFSTSSGYTENSEEIFVSALPYLRSVESSWDTISPVFSEEKSMSVNDFCLKLNLKYTDNLIIEVIDQTSTGRVNQININNVTFSKEEIINTFSLRSSYFEITQVGSNIIINTKGYGHGVGMSQYGAQGMAQDGYTYDEILKHYYTGVEIKKIY